jgi:hypothetical protein
VKKTPIREAWLSYLNEVVPAGAHPNQIIETRRAFYAGAQSFLAAMTTNLALGDGITEADMNLIAGIDTELREFVEQIKAGTA